MTDHTPEPCGCRVTLTEAGTYLGAITYCPTHAAAPALLVALEEIVACLGDTTSMREHGRAAIAAARSQDA